MSHVPHDGFVKAMMMHPEVAHDFFATHLPAHVISRIDLSTLELQSTSFIDETLRRHESDLIFEAKLKDGQTATLYVLLEHQSQSDPLMAFRLLYYLMQGLRRHVLKREDNPLPLPVIFPTVLYNGVRPWKHDRTIFPLFGEFEFLARQIFLEPFQLIDVSMMQSEDFQKQKISNLMLLSLYRSMKVSFREKIALLGKLLHDFNIRPNSTLGEIVVEYNAYELEAKEGDSGIYWEMMQESFPPEFEEVTMNLMEATFHDATDRIKANLPNVMRKAIELIKQDVPVSEIVRLTDLPIEVVELLSNQVVH